MADSENSSSKMCELWRSSLKSSTLQGGHQQSQGESHGESRAKGTNSGSSSSWHLVLQTL